MRKNGSAVVQISYIGFGLAEKTLVQLNLTRYYAHNDLSSHSIPTVYGIYFGYCTVYGRAVDSYTTVYSRMTRLQTDY